MTESEFPGAPTWLQIFYKRMERRDATMVEKFCDTVRETVQDELKPVIAEMEAAISQARGYSTVVGQGTAKIERVEDRLAKVEKKLDSLHGPKPPAKATAAPSRRPKLAAVSGTVDHTPTIPAPPSTSLAEPEDDGS